RNILEEPSQTIRRLEGRPGDRTLVPWVEQSPRRVRVYFNGVAVADSLEALLAFEPKRLPVYWFPKADVSGEHVRPAGPAGSTPSRATRFDVVAGQRRAEKAAWTYPDPGPGLEALRDHIAFYWNEMDAWYEEDDEVFVHPRDPYHRVDVARSSRHIRVEIAGQVVAESSRPCRSEEHTSELQSLAYLVCRLLLEKKKKKKNNTTYTQKKQIRQI